jgi:hypothetical protein
MNPRDLRSRADLVRGVPLETVLRLRGAVRDRRDPAKWETEQGPLSVTGSQFMNWSRLQGGGCAIDLVMHLAGLGYGAAVQWLERNTAGYGVLENHVTRSSAPGPSVLIAVSALRLPPRDDHQLNRVREYLTRRRQLSAALLDPLLQSGRLYADQRGNAVFVMVRGKPNQPVGAELRGTGSRVWRGMAPGSRKDRGYFWIGDPRARVLVLCESAIDAISCFQLRGSCIGISTAGVRADPAWLPGLIACGYEIHCGFDTDEAGEAAAAHLIVLHPAVQRLRPPAHDWNDALALRS